MKNLNRLDNQYCDDMNHQEYFEQCVENGQDTPLKELLTTLETSALLVLLRKKYKRIIIENFIELEILTRVK